MSTGPKKRLDAETLALLEEQLGPGSLRVDPDTCKTYGRDWTKIYSADPAGVAFPKSTDEVARILRVCSERRIPVVPSGGRTGLSGGAVAARGELVISLEKMNKIDPVDLGAMTVRAQAGTVTQAVHEHCEKQGVTWPVDFASKGSSQIGGNIATNAGGIRVIRYGLTRNWVLGLQVVTARGEILDLNGRLEKNNAGYDLRSLFIGSEGTLGVITEATLKLARLPDPSHLYFFATEDLASVLGLFRAARMGPFTITAYEFLTRNCMQIVTEHRKLRSPFSADRSGKAGCYVILEVERPKDERALENWLNSMFEQRLILDGTLAQGPGDAREFWSIRESIAESIYSKGEPHKNDVSLPISQLEPFCAELYSFFETHYPGWEIFNFGHIGDGNLHINVLKPAALSKEEFLARTHQVDTDLFTLVKKYQGSISAEHGIGLLKKDFLGFTRSEAEVHYFRAIKRAFDPQGILNPGKVFD